MIRDWYRHRTCSLSVLERTLAGIDQLYISTWSSRQRRHVVRHSHTFSFLSWLDILNCSSVRAAPLARVKFTVKTPYAVAEDSCIRRFWLRCSLWLARVELLVRLCNLSIDFPPVILSQSLRHKSSMLTSPSWCVKFLAISWVHFWFIIFPFTFFAAGLSTDELHLLHHVVRACVFPSGYLLALLLCLRFKPPSLTPVWNASSPCSNLVNVPTVSWWVNELRYRKKKSCVTCHLSI